MERLGVWLGCAALMTGVGLGCGASDSGGGQTPGGSTVSGPMTPNVMQMTPGASNPGAGTNVNPTQNPGTGNNPVNPAAGTGGGPSIMMPTGSAGSGPAPTTPTGNMPEPGAPMAMDECGLHTNYAGDEYCILPPPPDKGFQLHIGPSNYDNPEPQYILPPGVETTNDFTAVSTNDKDIYFYYRQIRQRNGAHHNIITNLATGGFGQGGRIATSNLLAEDSPEGGKIAPENADVGIPLPPKTTINVSLHSINTTQADQLREVWVNFWYVDPAKVKEPVEEMFQTGDIAFTILPGEDRILGPYTCSLVGDGRMLWFYGHRHANNVQFTATRIRGGKRDIFYDATNWEEPLVLEYSSTVTNPAPDLAHGVEGGWNGILDFKTGDTIEWQCHVVNNSGGILAFTNNTYTGEMCIMDAELVGVNCSGF